MNHHDQLVTAGFTHPSPIQQRSFRRALLAARRKVDPPRNLVWNRNLDAIEALDPSTTAVCICYFHHKSDNPAVVDALDRFVSAGGALLAVHGVAASFKGNSQFEKLLGGVFTGHGPISKLRISLAGDEGSTDHAVFQVVDEPYEHRVSGDIVEIQRWSREVSGDGADNRPGEGECAWQKSHGRGKVAYLSLGHLGRVWRSSDVRRGLADLLGRLEPGP